MGEHFFWITSRSAGIVALLASSAAVALGLMMSMRMRKGQDLRVLHEALSLATMVALAVHALALLGDGYLKPSLADVTIPFVSDYERWWMSLGIIGGWLFVILGLSYYLRGRIGPQRWRKLHRFTALAWVLGVVHSIGDGHRRRRALVPARGRDARPPRGRPARAAAGARDMRFNCFGTRCGVWGAGAADARAAARGLARPVQPLPARQRAQPPERRPAPVVPVSATMARLLDAVREVASRATGGLVDGTLAARDRGRRLPRRPRRAAPARDALALAPPRRPAAARRPAISVLRVPRLDGDAISSRLVARRPPGVAIDSGGLAKGLFADLIAERHARRASPSTAAATCASAARRAGSRSPIRSAGRRCTSFEVARRRGRDERDRPAVVARRARPPGPPPARPRDRPARRSPASSRPPRSRRPRSRRSGAPRPPC